MLKRKASALIRSLSFSQLEYNSGTGFDKLPDEIVLEIFSFLEWDELCSSGLVSRRWKRLYRDESLWSALVKNYRREFSSLSEFVGDEEYRSFEDLRNASFGEYDLFRSMKLESRRRAKKALQRRFQIRQRKNSLEALIKAPKISDVLTKWILASFVCGTIVLYSTTQFGPLKFITLSHSAQIISHSDTEPASLFHTTYQFGTLDICFVWTLFWLIFISKHLLKVALLKPIAITKLIDESLATRSRFYREVSEFMIAVFMALFSIAILFTQHTASGVFPWTHISCKDDSLSALTKIYLLTNIANGFNFAFERLLTYLTLSGKSQSQDMLGFLQPILLLMSCTTGAYQLTAGVTASHILCDSLLHMRRVIHFLRVANTQVSPFISKFLLYAFSAGFIFTRLVSFPYLLWLIISAGWYATLSGTWAVKCFWVNFSLLGLVIQVLYFRMFALLVSFASKSLE